MITELSLYISPAPGCIPNSFAVKALSTVTDGGASQSPAGTNPKNTLLCLLSLLLLKYYFLWVVTLQALRLFASCFHPVLAVFTSVFLLIQMILTLYFTHVWLCVDLVFAFLLDIWWFCFGFWLYEWKRKKQERQVGFKRSLTFLKIRFWTTFMTFIVMF